MKSTDLKQKCQGVFTVLVTPFKENFEIDFAGLRRNIDYCINGGVNGVVIGGSLGEFSSLTLEERFSLIKAGTEAVDGRVTVIATTAHSCLKDAIRLNKYAQEVGADGVLMTAPYYCAPPAAGIYDFFQAVTSASDIGIVLYNTSRSGVNLDPEFILRLSELPHVAGLKQGTRIATEQVDTVELLGNRLAILSGSEEITLPNYSIGMVGTTAVSSGFMPRRFIDIFNLARQNEFSRARELFIEMNPYFRIVRACGHPAVAKEALRLMGLAAGPMRPPMVAKNVGKLEELSSVLKNLGLDVVTSMRSAA